MENAWLNEDEDEDSDDPFRSFSEDQRGAQSSTSTKLRFFQGVFLPFIQKD